MDGHGLASGLCGRGCARRSSPAACHSAAVHSSTPPSVQLVLHLPSCALLCLDESQPNLREIRSFALATANVRFGRRGRQHPPEHKHTCGD